MSGSHLFSHAVTRIVPSAVVVFTVVFGMGTGVAPQRIATRQIFRSIFKFKKRSLTGAFPYLALR